MSRLIIRNETRDDYAAVESLTRNAFWNLNVPGCNEHYLVHVMRGHEDFIPELALVAVLDGRIIGNIMYTKARLEDGAGTEKPILSFGPLSIAPEHQRRGYGKLLIEYSFGRARELGYDVIVIFGDPANYVSAGFLSCKKYGVCLEKAVFPAALLVKELYEGALPRGEWFYRESPVYDIDEEKAQEFDKRFEAKKKEHTPSQEIFFIQSRSVLK